MSSIPLRIFVVSILASLATLAPSSGKGLAPAEEAAQVHQSFLAWMAQRPPEQQAWEKVLEANLGKVNRLIYERDKVNGRPTEYDYVQDDPALPRVLLIGDSISCGYTFPVRQMLAGKANVHRAPENCGATLNGVQKLSTWLAGEKWDVIHFNFGIHDRNVPLTDYAARIEELSSRLQSTGAKVIWASTTPVPGDTPEGPAIVDSVVARNLVAAQTMEKHGVEIDDLFRFISPHCEKVRLPQNFHYTPEGYQLLGRRVADVIEAALPVRKLIPSSRTGSTDLRE